MSLGNDLSEKSKKFADITLKILQVGQEYNEIDPLIGYRFQNLVGTFIDIMKLTQEKDMSNLEMQVKVFENMFNFSLDEEIKKRVNEFSKEDSPEEIKKIDNEILSKIKKNISEYLEE